MPIFSAAGSLRSAVRHPRSPISSMICPTS
jgi:hypothetical protein